MSRVIHSFILNDYNYNYSLLLFGLIYGKMKMQHKHTSDTSNESRFSKAKVQHETEYERSVWCLVDDNRGASVLHRSISNCVMRFAFLFYMSFSWIMTMVTFAV